jgi:hypothetical protein
VNFFPAIAVNADGTIGATYFTDFYSANGDLNPMIDFFNNGKPAAQRDFVSPSFPHPTLNPNSDSVLNNCVGFSAPSIGSSGKGLFVAFPTTLPPGRPTDLNVDINGYFVP